MITSRKTANGLATPCLAFRSFQYTPALYSSGIPCKDTKAKTRIGRYLADAAINSYTWISLMRCYMLRYMFSDRVASKPFLVFMKSAAFRTFVAEFSKQQANIKRSLRTSIDKSHRFFLGVKREDDASWTVDTPCSLQPITGLISPLVPKEK